MGGVNGLNPRQRKRRDGELRPRKCVGTSEVQDELKAGAIRKGDAVGTRCMSVEKKGASPVEQASE